MYFYPERMAEKGVRKMVFCYVQAAIGLLDNGYDTDKRIVINNYCCDYLYSKYGDIDKESLRYDKWGIYK